MHSLARRIASPAFEFARSMAHVSRTDFVGEVRDLARDLLPPVVSRYLAQHAVLRTRERIFTLEELDGWIERAEAAHAVSDDEFRRVLNSFEFVTSMQMPRDPFSESYAAAQRELYAEISGHRHYLAEEREQTQFELGAALQKPFPYLTHSTATVGEQLVRQGLLLRQLQLRPGARVIEFGPGWGNLTLELAKMGLAVTAVDVHPGFGELISERAKQLGLSINVVVTDMLDYQASEPFDAAIFFESFHHCSDHLQMLRNLAHIVGEEGVVAFGSEPVTALPYPWGLRMDGMAVWSIRRLGWLENGFTPRYFFKALGRTGWRAETAYSLDIPSCSVIVARRRPA